MSFTADWASEEDNVEPQSVEQVKGWVDYLNLVIAFLSGTAGVGIIWNLLLVQAIEAFDHAPFLAWACKPGTKEIGKPQAIVLALVGAIVLTMVFCGFTREVAVLALVGCPVSIGFSAFLDWKGWNLDRMFGQVEAPK